MGCCSVPAQTPTDAVPLGFLCSQQHQGEGGGYGDAGAAADWERAHVGPNSCAGGGKQEQEAAEGCGSPGPEQTASSPQGLCLCRGPDGAVFHSRPHAMRFGSDGG